MWEGKGNEVCRLCGVREGWFEGVFGGVMSDVGEHRTHLRFMNTRAKYTCHKAKVFCPKTQKKTTIGVLPFVSADTYIW